MIHISEEVIDGVVEMAVGQAAAIGACPPEAYVRYYLDCAAHARALFPVASNLAVTAGTKVVEIGSGIGLRCLLARELFGAECVGVEPCRNAYSALGRVIRALRAANPQLPYTALACCGEETGLPEESFDVALSFEVIEHVQDPERVLAEIFRVLKPGGKAYLSTCNYASFYEGHFRCFWWPFAGKRWQALYLRFIGRNPAFLGELNLITKRRLLHAVKTAGFTVESIGCRPAAARSMPPLEVVYPGDFALPAVDMRPCLAHRWVEQPRVAARLARIDREYKLCLGLTKP